MKILATILLAVTGIPIIQVLVVLILLGLIVWAAITYVPMTEGWKRFIKIVAIVLAVIYLLNVFGFLDSIMTIHT